MILVVGEILFDIFPEYRRIGGAPFNFSYHLKQFDIPISFVSRVGKDSLGKDILNTLKTDGFDARGIQVDPDHPTGRVTVTPDGSGGHSFDIKPDVAYDHIEFPASPERLTGDGPPELIYFGTLMQRTPSAFKRTQAFLGKRSPQTRCFYDINLRPNCFNHEVIESSLRHADILKLNEDELDYIQDMFDKRLPYESFVEWLMKYYNIGFLALTRGGNGSEIFTDTGHYESKTPALDQVVDTVGAGDAYSALLAIGYLNNWSPRRILSIGTAFASDICRIKGAVPDDPDFYKPYKQQIAGG